MKMIRAVVAGAMLALAGNAIAQGVKIGVVDTRRIEQESAQSVKGMEALKREFEPRNKQISELQRQIKADQERLEKERDKLSAADLKSREAALIQKMRQSDQLVQSASTDFEIRRNESATRILEDANAAIKAVAEGGKFDLILQQAIYVRPGIDITDQVLKEMAKRAK